MENDELLSQDLGWLLMQYDRPIIGGNGTFTPRFSRTEHWC